MTLHDLTTLCVNAHVMSQHPGPHLLIISSVSCKDGNDSYEQLVHWGEFASMFGYIKTARVRRRIRWWHHFSSDVGSHDCVEQLFQCGKKCVYVEEYEGFSSKQWTNILNVDRCCGCHFHWMITTQVFAETIRGTWSTTFGLVWPQEGPGDEVILASVCNRTQRYWHETMSQGMCFVVGMISGSFVSWESSLFRWMCSSLQLSWNVFWS